MTQIVPIKQPTSRVFTGILYAFAVVGVVAIVAVAYMTLRPSNAPEDGLTPATITGPAVVDPFPNAGQPTKHTN